MSALSLRPNIIYVRRASGAMWNQLFLNKKKKKAKGNDLEGVCLSAFTECQLPFFCSMAAQCEAAAAAAGADLGELGVLCKAAAPPVAGRGSDAASANHKSGGESSALELLCFASAWVLCVVFLQ